MQLTLLYVGRVNGMVDILIVPTRLTFCALKFRSPLIRRLRDYCESKPVNQISFSELFASKSISESRKF